MAIEAKQPVAMVLPDRDGIGVPVMPNMVSLVSGAPHPEEGKRLIDYLLSPEVERKLAESEAVQIPLHADVPVRRISRRSQLQADDARLREGGHAR